MNGFPGSEFRGLVLNIFIERSKLIKWHFFTVIKTQFDVWRTSEPPTTQSIRAEFVARKNNFSGWIPDIVGENSSFPWDFHSAQLWRQSKNWEFNKSTEEFKEAFRFQKQIIGLFNVKYVINMFASINSSMFNMKILSESWTESQGVGHNWQSFT